MNRIKYFSRLWIVFTVMGLLVTVFLIQHQQDIRNRAAELDPRAPVVTLSGLNTNVGEPYKSQGVWRGFLRSTNLATESAYFVRLYDTNGQQWGEDIPLEKIRKYADATPTTPTLWTGVFTTQKIPPSGCNSEYVACEINLKVFNQALNLESNFSTLSILTYPAQQVPNPELPFTSPPSIPQQLPLNQIRSTTINFHPYEFGSPDGYINGDFKEELPQIKQNGFNTIWFILPLVAFDFNRDVPTAKRAYYQLHEILLELAKNKMHAILPLTYSTSCSDLFNHEKYAKYLQLHKEFLTNIQAYSSMVDIEIFTESTWGCLARDSNNTIVPVIEIVKVDDPNSNDASKTIDKAVIGYNQDQTPIYGEFVNVTTEGKEYAPYIKESLGRLPYDLRQMNPTLRSKFRFGYHDIFIAYKWISTLADSTLAQNHDYDFFTWGDYYDPYHDNIPSNEYPHTKEEMRQKVATHIANIRALYPTIPLLRGEMGAFNCYIKLDNFPDSNYQDHFTDEKQKEMDVDMTSYMIEQNIGLNVWAWPPLDIRRNSDSCVNASLSLTHAHIVNNKPIFTLRPAAEALKTTLTPTIELAGVTTNTTGQYAGLWRGFVRGKNLDPNFIFARLYDQDGKRWGDDLPVNLLSNAISVGYTLPGKIAPSQCNIGKQCNITVRLYNQAMDKESNPYTITLDSVETPPTPTPYQLTIQQGSINTSFNPWVVALSGINLNEQNAPFTAKVFGPTGAVWQDNIPVAASTFVSFFLPSSTGPGGCNIGIVSDCKIQVQIKQTASGVSSNRYTLTLPAIEPTHTPTPTPTPTLTPTPRPTNTPVPTATNTPVPTNTIALNTHTPIPPTNTSIPGVTPSYLRSDFGGLGGSPDGKVDIQDLNILAGEFYQTRTSYKADIIRVGDSLNKVDIQDYNAFVTDFQAYINRP